MADPIRKTDFAQNVEESRLILARLRAAARMDGIVLAQSRRLIQDSLRLLKQSPT